MLSALVDLPEPGALHGQGSRLEAWLGPLGKIDAPAPLAELMRNYSQPIVRACGQAGGGLGYDTLSRNARARPRLKAGHWWRLEALEGHFTRVRATLFELCSACGADPTYAHASGYLHSHRASVPRHCDRPYIVAVQVFGRRTWRLDANTSPPHGLDDPLSAPVPFTGWDEGFSGKSFEIVLERGSVLGVPRGWWHQTFSHEPSFAVSFVMP